MSHDRIVIAQNFVGTIAVIVIFHPNYAAPEVLKHEES